MRLKHILKYIVLCIIIGMGLTSCFKKESAFYIDSFDYEIHRNENSVPNELSYQFSFDIVFSLDEDAPLRDIGIRVYNDPSKYVQFSVDSCNTEDVFIHPSSYYDCIVSLGYTAAEKTSALKVTASLKLTTKELISDINQFIKIDCNTLNVECPIIDPHNLCEDGIFKMNYSDLSDTETIYYEFDEFTESYKLVSVITNAKSLVIPDMYQNYPVKTIDENAFNAARHLESLVLPASLTSLPQGLLGYMTELQSLTIPFVGESKTSQEHTYLGYLFGATSYDENRKVPRSLKEVIITSCDSIGDYAFYKCDQLTKIIIPETITRLGYGAFSECSSLVYNEYDNGYYLGNEVNPYLVLVKAKNTTINSCLISANTRFIASSAFAGCNNLNSITINKEIEGIGAGAFSSLNEVYYEGTIRDWCQLECSVFDNIDHDNHFYLRNSTNQWEEVTCIEIPNTIKKIDAYQFYGFNNVTSITIPDSVTSIESGAFAYCNSLTSIVIPDSVTSIGYKAFEYCNSLTSIVISDSVTSIEGSTFAFCKNLTDITFGNNVTIIGDSAFLKCINLKNVVLPNSVKIIKDNAFYMCERLKYISIPDGLTSIGKDVFSSCFQLNYNEYDNAYYLGNETNPYVLLMRDKSSDKTNYKINSNTKIIYRNAFSNCKYLKTIIIPDGVISIGRYAFYDCPSLTTITIPSSVQIIGYSAFGECSSLVYNEYDNGYYLGNETNPYLWFIQAKSKDIKSCEVHSDTVHIVPYAFEECKEIRKLILHDHLISIGESIFTIDYSIVEIYYDGTPSEWSSLTAEDNDLISATTYYYSETTPTEEGNYWHYVDGVVTKW